MAAPFVKSIALPSGAKIPVVGLGVYLSEAGAEAYNAVRSALKLGYRHVDSATFYQNEADVGRAIRDSGVPREEVFVTSKFHNFAGWSYESTVDAVKASLEKFGFDYIDLYLIHAPCASEKRSDAWRALEDMQAQGYLKDIGVSNFGIDHLKKLEETWRVKPAINQFELHPFCQRKELTDYCKEQGIVVQAFCPVTRGVKFGDPTVVEIAAETGATPAQVLLAWGISKGFVVLPKSVNESRIEENLNSAKVALTSAQIAKLDAKDEYLVVAANGDWDPIKKHEV